MSLRPNTALPRDSWPCRGRPLCPGPAVLAPNLGHSSQRAAAGAGGRGCVLTPRDEELPSQEKVLGTPPAAASTTQPPLPRQAALSPLTFPTDPSGFLALALCDSLSGGVAAFLRMGEQLRVLSEGGAWWLVALELSGKEYRITSSCVTKARHRWLYEGVSWQKAEELLLRPGNCSGSFLIRESQRRQGCYSLSSGRLTFPSPHDLGDHCSEFGEGLCCLLREPCSMEGVRVAPVPAMPIVVKKPSLNWNKIDRGHMPTRGLSPQEAISSHLLLTEAAAPVQGPAGKGAKSS
ncbi:LOW QUALITY PROTEIN: src-like-adapter 2 [Podargus strigoides]